MRNHTRHLQHISRTPAMATCGVGEPSTTSFLPCLLSIFGAAFAAIFSGFGALTTALVPLGENLALDISDVLLAIRSLPWKVVGPIV